MNSFAVPRQDGREPIGASSDAEPGRARETVQTGLARRWVDEYADLLYRQALLRVGNVEDAKDIVQETLIAAVRASPPPDRLNSEKAWLLGIMKHKVLDLLRRRYRQPVATSGDELEQLAEGQFEAGGGIAHWRPRMAPGNWARAEAKLESGEFADILKGCLERLPERHARAFILRELDGFGTDRLCAEFNLKPGHVFVMLHRARLALRRCLELSGLRPGKRTS